MDAKEARVVLGDAARQASAQLARAGVDTTRERLAALLAAGHAHAALGSPKAHGILLETIDAAEGLGDRLAERQATLALGAWLVSHGDASVGRACLESALEAAN